MERSQAEKDKELWKAFNALAYKNPEGRLAQIEMLIEEGATTGFFEDYELGQYNYATAVRHFLEGRFSNEPSRERDLIRSFHTLLHAGRAPWTNRAYVGNGGVTAIWWCFDYLGQVMSRRRLYQSISVSVDKLQSVYSLVSAITELTPQNDPVWGTFLEGFWTCFVPRLRSLNRLEKELQLQMKSFYDLGLHCTFHKIGADAAHAYWLGSQATHVFDSYHPISRTLDALVDSQNHEYLSQLLIYFEKSEGILADMSFPPEMREPALKNALGVFLRSRESRQLAIEFIQRSKWLRAFLVQSTFFSFALVEKRERRLLKAMLKHESRKMRQLRDADGRSLLLFACSQRVRNEKLIQLLLDHKFDPFSTDDSGLNAINLAKAHKKEGLARLMTSEQ
ncbi:MAG: hypothetical protein P1V97_37585 [Planctomycetota bacterium]|nr:hypothetical protein [Planctomycetota bacterium]